MSVWLCDKTSISANKNVLVSQISSGVKIWVLNFHLRLTKAFWHIFGWLWSRWTNDAASLTTGTLFLPYPLIYPYCWFSHYSWYFSSTNDIERDIYYRRSPHYMIFDTKRVSPNSGIMNFETLFSTKFQIGSKKFSKVHFFSWFFIFQKSKLGSFWHVFVKLGKNHEKKMLKKF